VKLLQAWIIPLLRLAHRVSDRLRGGCPWGQTFFGLTPKDKVLLHKELYSLIYHSNGGMTYTDVYALPVQNRRFYLKELQSIKLREEEAIKNATPSKKR
jgi:hypothetical protein